MSAVLSAEQESCRPVVLQACKSMFGHSEAAAGTAGLLFSCIELSLAKTFDLVHLRTLNPHVEPLLADPATASAKLYAPRQSNPLCARESSVQSGLSSFAYQVRSTLAHLLHMLSCLCVYMNFIKFMCSEIQSRRSVLAFACSAGNQCTRSAQSKHGQVSWDCEASAYDVVASQAVLGYCLSTPAPFRSWLL
jgi:hypothetical protein